MLVRIQMPTRTIFVDAEKVAAIDADLPQPDRFAHGRWSAQVDVHLSGGGKITFFVDGSDPDFVLEKTQEIVDLLFSHKEEAQAVIVN